jgi:hypothetical protein
MTEITISKDKLIILGCTAFSLPFFIIGSFEQQLGFYLIGFLLLFVAFGVMFKNDKCMQYLSNKVKSENSSDKTTILSETENLNTPIVDNV